MNHNTKKLYKLSTQDMSEMQTLLAEALGMERGTSKELTGREYLERTDYIIAKQKQEAEKAQAIKKQAETEVRRIEEKMKELEQFGHILDDELTNKKRQLEAADIKEITRSYGGKDSEQQKSIGKWLVGYAENRKQPILPN